MPKGRSIKRDKGGSSMRAPENVAVGRSGKGGRQHKKNCACHQCRPQAPSVVRGMLKESEIEKNEHLIHNFITFMREITDATQTFGKPKSNIDAVTECLLNLNKYVSFCQSSETPEGLAVRFALWLVSQSKDGKLDCEGGENSFSNGFLGSQWVDWRSSADGGLWRWGLYAKADAPENLPKFGDDVVFVFLDCGPV